MVNAVLPHLRMAFPLDLSGRGFIGGLPASGPGEADGLARVMNVPGVVRIRVYESRSGRLVAATTSAPDGAWRIDGLALNVPFRVIGMDPSRQVNSAIQDWVYAAPMEP